MAADLIKVPFGKDPINFGDYDELVAQGKTSFDILNRVNRYGCEWESKIDNNTYAPATLVDGEVVPDTQHWRLNSGVPSNYNLDIKVGKLETDVNDLKSAVGTGGSVDTRISNAVSSEASERSSADTALGNRITPLETAVGTGGSVDTRISNAVNAAKSEIKGSATSACDTLGEAETLISANATAISNEATARANAVSAEVARAQTAEENLRTLYNNLQQSQPIPVTSLPQTGEAGKIYRLAGINSYADYMYAEGALTTPIKMAEYNNAISPKAKQDDPNIITGDGAFMARVVSEQSLVLPDILRSAFCRLYDSDILTFNSGYIDTNCAIGEILDLTPQPVTSQTMYCIVNCNSSTYFYISGVKGGQSARLYCFVDSNNKVLAVSEKHIAMDSAFSGFIKAPIGTAKAVFQKIDNYGSVYVVSVNSYINIGDFPGAFTSPLEVGQVRMYVDEDGFHVGSFVIIRNNYATFIRPENVNEVFSITQQDSGYVVYNFTTNLVRFESTYSNIKHDDYVLEYASYGVFFGGSTTARNQSENYFRTNHIYDIYSSIDAEYSNNSVELSQCVGVIGGIYNVDSIINDGVVTKETFTFTQNSYLVYNRKDKSARISLTYTDIGKNELIWLYYKNGSFIGGLLYSDYISKKTITADRNNIIIKRAQQLYMVRWNAKSPVPTPDSHTGIAVGEHVGLPYTSCMEVDKFVGFDVSLKTFMTAANNPYSLLYTEDLNRNISGYGFTYHNTGRTTIGGYMGIVCNIFALYSVGYPIPFDTGNFDYMRLVGDFVKLGTQNISYAEAGDIIWEPGHGNIIIDVVKDINGYASSVIWAESTSPFPLVHRYTLQQANERLQNNGGIIYRLRELDKYKFYERNPFVATDGETIDESYVYNNDICTFAGDCASFRKGQTIYLNYNLSEVGTWQSIEIYKDATLIDTLAIDTSSHRIEITGLNLDYGMYKARMKDGNTYSDYTYFEVVETNVTCELNNGVMTVNFGSSNGYPLYVELCKIDGGPIAKIPLTSEDVRSGKITFNPSYYLDRQGYSVVHNGTYLKVKFSGEYGRVTNAPILTEL